MSRDVSGQNAWIKDELDPQLRAWEEFYRNRWQHDRVVRSTHGVNCTGGCTWNIHVKDGIVTWEMQGLDYPALEPGLPPYEPRGCQRGISYSWYLYSPLRVKHPYVRGALLAGGPFDEFHSTPDVRKPRGRDGRLNIPTLGFHLYRLRALRLVGIDRRDVESISQLYVRASADPSSLISGTSDASGSAGPVPTRLDNLVTFEYHEAASRIDRLNRQRMVAVRANIDGGYALGDRIAAMNVAAEEIGLPPGFSTQVLGGGRELERTLEDFAWTFVLSFVLMYIVLAAQYEHLVHPFVILLSLPLAVPFGLLSLIYGGETLNLYSAMGILVLFGVVKKAAILQVDHTNALRATGMNRADAILRANRDRLRPILMTTVSFVAGLLPLLIATGPGAEERRSIAVLAVGGQTFSLLLTLLAIPVLYSFFDDLGNLLKKLLPSTTKGDLFEELGAKPLDAFAAASRGNRTLDGA